MHVTHASGDVRQRHICAHQIPSTHYWDYLVTMGIDPFKLMVNSLIKLVNRMAYLDKEKSVEALRALLKERNGP